MNARLEQLAPGPAIMTPDLVIADAHAAYWIAQVNIRLRREIAWCWHQRMQQPPVEGVLPPVTDATMDSLDQVRFARQKQVFFATDPAAVYLSEQIGKLRPAADADTTDDSRWRWCVQQLELGDAEQFVLALGLSVQLDAGLAPVFATCLNDLNRPFLTLGLAQRLWDSPQQIIACADPGHSLYRSGLLKNHLDGNTAQSWQSPVEMPAIVARQLIDPDAPLPFGMQSVVPDRHHGLNKEGELLASRLRADSPGMRLVPLLGPRGVAYQAWAATLSHAAGRGVVAVNHQLAREAQQFPAVAAVCWMRDSDIVLPDDWSDADNAMQQTALLQALEQLPLCCYVPMQDSATQHHYPDHLITPPLIIEGLDFQQRLHSFQRCFPSRSKALSRAIEDCARRFRFQEQSIEQVAQVFAGKAARLTAENIYLACANAAVVEMGNLAQRVQPRFQPEELVLPVEQSRQFNDILHAMRSLTLVHYHWGTARAWNESGLSVLFCGTPGTGKTMAAEALGNALGLPMYRIDLSQVVNKYIGETEKNLRRIFDAAELSDCILFFDEADALFGKRTEVRDAHDRFANIEISYLLERMERFKGLAILATNRRKDLDEAFMRRLRYVIEFPVPGIEERLRIWQQVFPAAVDTSELDMRFLARQFQLSGGHIRSIAFNACLRAADSSRPERQARVTMVDTVFAIKRELEKINRSAGNDLFGQYSHLLASEVVS